MPTRSDSTSESSGEFDSKHFLKQLTERPGVYRMYDEGSSVLYVGKAGNLKKRVSSYFRKTGLAPKTEALVAKIASIELEFEKGADRRDQINHLRHVQEQQSVDGEGGDADVIAIAQDAGVVCIVVIIVRGGRVLGTKDYFPRYSLEQSDGELLGAFLGQYYFAGDTRREIPQNILVSSEPEGMALLAEALSEAAKRDTRIRGNVRGERRRWLELAQTNARQTLLTHLASKETVYRRLLALRDMLDLAETPSRMECFDISHSHGENTVASCVVFDENGPLKSDYRLYNIEGVTAGDDYGAMRQVCLLYTSDAA